MSFIAENAEWIFSGIGVFVIATVYTAVTKKNKSAGKTTSQKNSIIINNNLGLNANQIASMEDRGDEKQKSSTRILFIDDKHSEYKMVSILKKSGWINTKSVKDVTDLDDPKVIEADIIFVDINGVGTTLFQDQGLGLASALKRKFPSKKIVIYSSETNGDRFHRALREVDDCLTKDAEPYQFINLIEGFLKK